MNQEIIEQKVQEWASAEAAGDAATLQTLLTGSFSGIGPRGFVLNKEQWLQRFGGLVLESVVVTDVQVHDYNTAAFVVAHYEQKGSFNGHRTDNVFRISQMWTQEGEQWKIAGLQYSTIDAGMPPARP